MKLSPISSAISTDSGSPGKLMLPVGYVPCNHEILIQTGKVFFDPIAAKNMSASEVRKHYPRYGGACPQCGESVGAMYYSFQHYIAGDW